MSHAQAFQRRLTWLSVFVFCTNGCSSPLFLAQSPDVGEFEKLVEEEATTKFVGDIASPWGDRWLKIEGVALVTQLSGTGSNPPPSPLLEQLKKEMQTHEVRGSREALASTDTAMVMVGGYIPPGAQKGDTFDLKVVVPPRSRTESLRGGWVMPARMRQVMMIESSLHSGNVAGIGQGEILVDALFETSDDETKETQGRVIGGGVVMQPRQFGLGIFDEHSSVRTSSMIGAAINERFHHFDRGEQSGVAKPLRDNQVELALHHRYKHNFDRYKYVILNIAVGETPAERSVRLLKLDRMLHEPITAQRAAIRLEAIGDAAVPILRKGIASSDPEVRFYAAEALAYLDQPSAAEALYDAARVERAFRWRAMTALAAMEHATAQDALVKLLDSPSAETRYGAFRALRANDPSDPLVSGQVLNKSFGYHTIGSKADPVIHFSKSKRPEIVVFGHGQRIDPPAFLFAGKEIMIKAVDREKLKVSSFKPGEETESVFCSPTVDDLIHAIVDLGGGYQEVLVAMQAAKKGGYLDARVEVGALPSATRSYHREEDSSVAESRYHVTDQIPAMFEDRLDETQSDKASDDLLDSPNIDAPEPTDEGWFARMKGWF
ncbi:MAG: flagellar basal body P-ring protein FlgI [Planctomycetaceae bacterium]|nr:flagellar basal body P-ring protein FlgI [Planctomycetales bacterium]MCB9874243.1 flagellar basal body P-ring protein FlgI [Planctomycetaceae bacterium]MCB9940775.1 flagellar basal body P-ring protein FlgI [Planctomycetaceae bacterium]